MNRFGGGFGGGANMQQLMRQAQKMQEEAVKAKKEIENRPVTMRSTFIIEKDGNLLKEMRNIDIQGHVDEIIDYVQTL